MPETNEDVHERAVASELERLQLEKLESEWVTEVIGNDFLQCQDLPISYEEILEERTVNSVIIKVQKILIQWLEANVKANEDAESYTTHVSRQSLGDAQGNELTSTLVGSQTNKGSKFWRFLFQESKVNIQSLLALIGFFIDRGCTLSSNSADRQRCFGAAELYLTMICIPGSMAFGVYHQMLFVKTMQLIQLYVQASKYQKTNTPTPAKKGHKHQQASSEIDEDDEEVPIAAADFSAIEAAMSRYLDALFLVAQHLSFRRYPNVLKETVECMLPMVGLNRGRISLKGLEIIQNFCNPLHGDAVQTVHHVFVHILPYLSLDPTDKDVNNKNLNALKDVSFNLVRSFISKFGEVIYPLVEGLIKHICVDVVDRAEYRQKTAQTALDLLQLIPIEHQQGIIFNILKCFPFLNVFSI